MRLSHKAIISAAIFMSVSLVGISGSHASGRFELTFIAPPQGGGAIIYRINVATGEVSMMSVVPILNIADPQPIPIGEYRLYSAETPDYKSYWLYRLDTLTGRTWFINNNSWSEIK